MIVSELITKIHIAYKGKLTNTPTFGDPKRALYLSRANDNQDRWSEDPAIKNPDLFGGDIELTLNSEGYADLPEEAAVITDPVMYGRAEIPVVPFTDRHIVDVGAYVVGKKGERRVYIINPDKYPLNSFTVGIQTYPDPMVNDTDEVGCSSVRWLALQTAAQLAEQDPAKEDLAPSLYNQATAEYQESIQRIKKQLRGSNKRIRVTGYPRIGGL